jgi:hypothetical protein
MEFPLLLVMVVMMMWLMVMATEALHAPEPPMPPDAKRWFPDGGMCIYPRRRG